MHGMICHPSGRAWHVIYTSPQVERHVQADLWDAGFETYLPIEREMRRIRGRRVSTSRPLLPRYLFVRFDAVRDGWGAIGGVDGVEYVLGADNAPARVPDALMAKLWGAEAVGAFDRTCTRLNVGDVVTVREGPFAGMHGVIESLAARMRSAKAKKRIKVLMDFLGSVEIDLTEVEKA